MPKMTILDLRHKRAKVWEDTKKFLDTHRGENGILSAEDDATYERMEKEICDLGKEIDRLERQEAIEKEMSKQVGDVLTTTPSTTKMDKKTGRASDEYRTNFWNMMRSKSPVIFNDLQEDVDTEGGYLVPDEFERILIEKLEEENVVRKIATTIRSSGDKKIPVVDSAPKAEWIEEEGAYPEGDEKFKQVVLGAHKLGTIVKVSEELLNDSAFDLQSHIASVTARAMGDSEENAFLTGDGNHKPLGILAAEGGAKEGVTAASATDIKADEMMDLFYSLKAPYRRKAVWLLNDATIKLIRKLKDGNGQYIWQPSIQIGAPEMLLGRPVYTSPNMPKVEAGAASVLFGDFSYYWIADRQTRSFKPLWELYAAKGQVGYKTFERVDGKLVLPEAIKILKQKTA